MSSLQYEIVDVFTDRPFAGNPLAVVFGVVAWIWPDITVRALVLLFGFYALVDGLLALAALVVGGQLVRDRRGWLLVEGIAGIAAGIVSFVWPGITALVLLYLIAAWAIATGVLEVVVAVWLRRELRGEWLLALVGVLSVLFGVFLVLLAVSRSARAAARFDKMAAGVINENHDSGSVS